jgi:uncharacterized protein DUF4440
MASEIQPNSSDQTMLEQLNAEYVRAFMASDVNWYEEHLVDDFVCIESDGSILNKSQFLSKAAEGPDVADYELQKVNVRIYGGVALVRATGLWTKGDQSSGLSHYIDVYVRTGAGWKAVSAQVTRASQPDGINFKHIKST